MRLWVTGRIVDEGEAGMLGICLFYKSAHGVNRARAKIQGIGGVIHLEGDDEIAGAIPVDRIEEALKLIKVSKLKPGNADFGNRPRNSDPNGS